MVAMFTLNTEIDGMGAVFKLHEEIALKVLAESDDYTGSRHIWEETNRRLEELGQPTRSRATYINFIKAVYDAHLIEAVTDTGKGGKRLNYRHKPDGLKGFEKRVSRLMIRAVINAFPDVDFVEVLNDLNIGG